MRAQTRYTLCHLTQGIQIYETAGSVSYGPSVLSRGIGSPRVVPRAVRRDKLKAKVVWILMLSRHH